MAKTQRKLFHLVCEECKNQNYLSSKNKINVVDQIEVRKYCKFCRKHTLHKERGKLK